MPAARCPDCGESSAPRRWNKDRTKLIGPETIIHKLNCPMFADPDIEALLADPEDDVRAQLPIDYPQPKTLGEVLARDTREGGL